MKEKKPQKNEKTTRDQTTSQKSYQRDKHLGYSSRRILGTILEVDEGRTATNGAKKKINDDALHSRDDVERLYVSRKKGGRGSAIIEDSVDASIRRLKDYIKKSWRRFITVTWNNTDKTRINRTTIIRKQKNGKKNKCMDISSDKQAKSYTWRLGHGSERETLRKKLNLS